MNKYGIIYLLNGEQYIFTSRFLFRSQRAAVAFFWGYDGEFRRRARVVATLKMRSAR